VVPAAGPGPPPFPRAPGPSSAPRGGGPALPRPADSPTGPGRTPRSWAGGPGRARGASAARGAGGRFQAGPRRPPARAALHEQPVPDSSVFFKLKPGGCAGPAAIRVSRSEFPKQFFLDHDAMMSYYFNLEVTEVRDGSESAAATVRLDPAEAAWPPARRTALRLKLPVNLRATTRGQVAGGPCSSLAAARWPRPWTGTVNGTARVTRARPGRLGPGLALRFPCHTRVPVPGRHNWHRNTVTALQTSESHRTGPVWRPGGPAGSVRAARAGPASTVGLGVTCMTRDSDSAPGNLN
jgi:hypothetical protein